VGRVTGLKKLLGADDALDVFGIHGLGGILGALLTGVFNTWALGGTGIVDYVNNTIIDTSIGAQVWIQAQAVLTAIVWSGVVALVVYKIIDWTIGLRVPEKSRSARAWTPPPTANGPTTSDPVHESISPPCELQGAARRPFFWDAW
jgi:ammonia channel protein AmtB